MLRAPVLPTSARIALPPIYFGHIDIRIQPDVRCALRSETPESVQVEAFGAEDTSTESSVGTCRVAKRYPGVDASSAHLSPRPVNSDSSDQAAGQEIDANPPQRFNPLVIGACRQTGVDTDIAI